ncbi:hypothetical protein L0244_37205 [bacterium]|nr:hypothetical protein [bacterium]
MLTEIVAAARAQSWKTIPYRPRISQNGRCIRAAVYDRLGYQEEKEPPGPLSIAMIEEGHIHEEDIKNKLRAIGVPVINEQMEIEIPAATHTGVIRGKIDGIIELSEDVIRLAGSLGITVPEGIHAGRYLLEAKSISHRGFDYLDELPLDHHATQCQTYLHKLLEAQIDTALIIYKNRDNGDWKEYWLSYDPAVSIAALEKFEQVESFAGSGTIPPRISSGPNNYPCSTCEFHKLCWANWQNELEALQPGNLTEEISAKVLRYRQLSESISALDKEKEQLKEEIKLWMSTNSVSMAKVEHLIAKLNHLQMKEKIIPAHTELRLNVYPMKSSKPQRSATKIAS